MIIYKDSTPRNHKFEELCVKTQEEMKEFVVNELLKRNRGEIIKDDGFVMYVGTYPVLLCAHMDTVHSKLPSVFVYANGTISSPQGIGGDDRCGIYMIFEVLKHYDCSVLFLEDEENGCIGARKFCASNIAEEYIDKFNFIVEYDRKGNNHAVFYECDNKEFTRFITSGFFEEKEGTCSDISYLAPKLNAAAVNLSCGYYDEHNLEHYVVLNEMETVIKESIKLIDKAKELEKPFEFVQAPIRYGKYGYYGYGYGYDYDDYYDSYYSRWYDNYNSNSTSRTLESDKTRKYEIEFIDVKIVDEYEEQHEVQFINQVVMEGKTCDDVLLKFLKQYDYIPYCHILEIYEVDNFTI